MKYNELSLIIRLLTTIVFLVASIATVDPTVSQLLAGFSIFIGVSIFKNNLFQNKKLEDYEEAK